MRLGAWVRRVLTGELIPMSQVAQLTPLPGSPRFAAATLRRGGTVAVERALYPPRRRRRRARASPARRAAPGMPGMALCTPGGATQL